MKKLQPFLLCLFSIFTLSAQAQAPFSTIDSIDVNNINASVLVHGDMWTDVAHNPKCEYPKGGGACVFSSAGIWIAGFDNASRLHVSATTDRQKGNDFWPGPLSTGVHPIDYSTSKNWARIWKINKSTIDSFRMLGTHTVANTPATILEWPAKGNMYAKGNSGASLVIADDMAPFVDEDHDGVYDALKGDYPDIKGDQALWYVLNDYGPTHTETNGLPLGVEIHVMPYAYKRGNILDNIIYYEYTIVNRSALNYSNFRLGLTNIGNLGYTFDDFVGCDSSQRLEIIYYAITPTTGAGGLSKYGIHIPMAGIVFINQPGDITYTNTTALGSCMYYNNDFSVMGNPASDTDYFNYLNATWRDRTHLRNDYKGAGNPSIGYGSGPNTNYIFSGNPYDTTQWSECSSQNLPGDHRNIIVSNNFSLPAASSQRLTIALLVIREGKGCPNTNFGAIDSVADSAKYFYYMPPAPEAVQDLAVNTSIHIYPNPAHDELNISGITSTGEDISVYNMLGERMNIGYRQNGNNITLDISNLSAAPYIIKCGTLKNATLFIKQ